MLEELVEGGNISATIKAAIGKAEAVAKSFEKGKSVTVVVLGSFFIMQEARKILGFEEEEDPLEQNQEKPIGFEE